MATGVNLANASVSSPRRALDFYPTPPDVTEALMQFLQMPPSKVWEPACGTGAMSEVIRQHNHTVVSSDLSTTYGKSGIDFLTHVRSDCGAIITNPPFAQSEAFIRHALSQTDVVCMLLKSQYWHAQKRISLFTDHPPAYVLPLTWRPDFMNGERGGAPTMEVLWTVWLSGNTETRYRPLLRPK